MAVRSKLENPGTAPSTVVLPMGPAGAGPADYSIARKSKPFWGCHGRCLAERRALCALMFCRTRPQEPIRTLLFCSGESRPPVNRFKARQASIDRVCRSGGGGPRPRKGITRFEVINQETDSALSSERGVDR